MWPFLQLSVAFVCSPEGGIGREVLRHDKLGDTPTVVCINQGQMADIVLLIDRTCGTRPC